MTLMFLSVAFFSHLENLLTQMKEESSDNKTSTY
jgi:hypothetical protein